MILHPLWFILVGPALLLGMWAMMRVRSTYSKWSQVGSRGGVRGAEAAQYLLRAAGIQNVDIVTTQGHLTDHYDPHKKRLVLSEENAHGTSLAALGVAAHEAGHAIQDAEEYSMLKLRMNLVPVTSFASQVLPFAILGGFLFNSLGLIWLGVIAYAILTVFQLVTLPVEFDASTRAKQQLVGLGILDENELPGVRKTLDAAAWTYVASFVASLANLIFLLLMTRR